MNSVNITGRLTKNPETGKATSGNDYCRFSVAVDDYGSNNTKKTSFIDVTAWGNTAANVAKFCVKGSMVGVSGRLQQDTWTAKDGTARSTLKVIANSVDFLNSKSESDALRGRAKDIAPASPKGGFTAQAQTAASDEEQTAASDEDMPF